MFLSLFFPQLQHLYEGRVPLGCTGLNKKPPFTVLLQPPGYSDINLAKSCFKGSVYTQKTGQLRGPCKNYKLLKHGAWHCVSVYKHTHLWNGAAVET